MKGVEMPQSRWADLEESALSAMRGCDCQDCPRRTRETAESLARQVQAYAGVSITKPEIRRAVAATLYVIMDLMDTSQQECVRTGDGGSVTALRDLYEGVSQEVTAALVGVVHLTPDAQHDCANCHKAEPIPGQPYCVTCQPTLEIT